MAPDEEIDLISCEGGEFHGFPAGINFRSRAGRGTPWIAYWRRSLTPGIRRWNVGEWALPLPDHMVANPHPDYIEIFLRAKP
jgi:hypothetical protein